MEIVERSVVAWGEGGMNRWSTEDFSVSKTNLYDNMIVESCHFTLLKMHTTIIFFLKNGVDNSKIEP